MNIQQLRDLRRSPIRNYIVPGLTSYLLGGDPSPENGCVRMFECSREHQEVITPHSHRFDFQCVVVAGHVHNTIWQPSTGVIADRYVESTLIYDGGVGEYSTNVGLDMPWSCETTRYAQGDWYGMSHDQVHSIRFGRGACVIFFEGQTKSDRSTILEPFVDGERVPTFAVAPWMFKRGAAS